MRYDAKHSDPTPRPACTCQRETLTNHMLHGPLCAITVERNARLCKGYGASGRINHHWREDAMSA